MDESITATHIADPNGKIVARVYVAGYQDLVVDSLADGYTQWTYLLIKPSEN